MTPQNTIIQYEFRYCFAHKTKTNVPNYIKF